MSQDLNTETLLTIMAKLQFLAKASSEKRITSHDPRYDAILIKTKALLTKFEKLIPAVMLSEVAHFESLAKDLYQMLKEPEENGATENRTNGRDN